jgi:hypothetical protein
MPLEERMDPAQPSSPKPGKPLPGYDEEGEPVKAGDEFIHRQEPDPSERPTVRMPVPFVPRFYIPCQAGVGMWPDERTAVLPHADGTMSAWVPAGDIIERGPAGPDGLAQAYLAVGITQLGDSQHRELAPGKDGRILDAKEALVSYMDLGDRGPRYLAVPASQVIAELTKGSYRRLEDVLGQLTWKRRQ